MPLCSECPWGHCGWHCPAKGQRPSLRGNQLCLVFYFLKLTSSPLHDFRFRPSSCYFKHLLASSNARKTMKHHSEAPGLSGTFVTAVIGCSYPGLDMYPLSWVGEGQPFVKNRFSRTHRIFTKLFFVPLQPQGFPTSNQLNQCFVCLATKMPRLWPVPR